MKATLVFHPANETLRVTINGKSTPNSDVSCTVQCQSPLISYPVDCPDTDDKGKFKVDQTIQEVEECAGAAVEVDIDGIDCRFGRSLSP